MLILVPILFSFGIIGICFICGILTDIYSDVGKKPFLGTAMVATACAIGNLFYWFALLLKWIADR